MLFSTQISFLLRKFDTESISDKILMSRKIWKMQQTGVWVVDILDF